MPQRHLNASCQSLTPLFFHLTPPCCLTPPPHCPSTPLHGRLVNAHFLLTLLTLFSRSLAPLRHLLATRRHPLMFPHCLLLPLCRLLAPLHRSVMRFRRSLTPLRHLFMSSSCLIISL